LTTTAGWKQAIADLKGAVALQVLLAGLQVLPNLLLQLPLLLLC
jgi:hypothetical protein